MTRFLSYDIRKNSRARWTASRNTQGLLTQRYTLERGVRAPPRESWEDVWTMRFALLGGQHPETWS